MQSRLSSGARSRAGFTLGLAVLLLPAALRAEDGVIEINDARALAGAKGNAPGYPVTLAVPGSYRLTGNLVQPAAGTAVVRVTADDVSLDLGGFEISGPFTCPGSPAGCATAGAGYAVDAGGASGVAVHHGSVRGTARGLLLGDHCAVSDVRVIETTENGITAGTGCVLSRVVVARNGRNGVQLFQGTVTDSAAVHNEETGFLFTLSNATITGSSARQNGGTGISGAGGTQVSSCVSSQNGLNGISLDGAAVVTSTTSSNNGVYGISAGVGSVVRSSSVFSNGDRGIELDDGSLAVGNTVRSNTDFGLVLGRNSGYRENVLRSNNGGLEPQVAAQVGEPIVDLGSNVCGSDTVCP